jgi:hypothetical protein|tara:strand:- start:753 stop:1073 length:321 start_codon:yes stop_codon:yes gene_type:complete
MPMNDVKKYFKTQLRDEGISGTILIMCVFALTGILITQISPLILTNILGLEGGFISGPWSYRALYIITIPPIYYLLLISIGTLLGKGRFFRARIKSTWGRILRIRT